VTEDRHPVRSYARIFTPDRRIFQVEGHRIPVPGGIQLAWLGWAVATLVAVVVLAGGSWPAATLVGAVAAVGGLSVGGRATAAVAGVAGLAAAQVAGFGLGVADWPLRLVVVPAAVATLATQATPDGRPAHRYALSWLALRLRPARRSLGRPLREPGTARGHAAEVAVRPDSRVPWLRPARVTGPAFVRFPAPVEVGRAGRRVCLPPRRHGRRVETVDRLDLAAGERLEVRP
jgi:hypothetical protein